MVPWQQLIDVLLFVSVDDGCEDAGQVAVRFDLVQFAGLDQRREHGSVLCASVVAREECVFTLQRDGPDHAFHGITVHFDATVGQEQDQAIPVFGHVFESEACRGFDRDLCSCVIQSDFEGRYLWRRFLLSRRQTFLSRCSAHLCLDPIEGSDLLEASRITAPCRSRPL